MSKKSKPATQVVPEDDTLWSSISSDLKAIVEVRELLADAIEARPYDPVSEVPMEEQKAEAMCRIRMHIRTKHLEEAVKLLRASREVWPEDNYFGRPGLNNDEELDILKQIFEADLGTPADYDENVIESNDDNITQEENVDDEEDEEESSQIRMEESNFEFIDFVKKFAKPQILHSCCLLLKDFDKNSIYTNHAVVKLLHRITYDCKYSSLMFQASVFRVFQKIFLSKNPSHKELKHFAVYIMRKFAEIAKKNNKVFIELLFWKDLKTAYEIEEGYDAEQNKKTTNWSEEQEDELHRLHEEYVRDMPEEDEVVWVLKNLIRQDRSRISVVKKMKQLGINLIKKNKKLDRQFSEAEIVQITQLVHEFKESNDPIRCIIEKLDVKRPKKHIIDKIVDLGLVRDRKELGKKRSKKSNQDHSSSDESNDSDDDNGEDFTYHSLTSVYVLNALQKVINKDMKPALLWLVESLNEAADDLDVDETDIPLLPLTDECMAAIIDDDFQEAMKILGIHKPSGIQETYWRIPGKWQANDIRQRSTAITNVIEGTFVADDQANTISRTDDSSDEDVGATFDRIRKALVPNYENKADSSIINTSLENNSPKIIEKLNNKENVKLNKKNSLNKKNFFLEDSDNEDVTSTKETTNLDNNDEANSDIEGNIAPMTKKRILLEDSDEEDRVVPIKKKTMLIDTDEEDSNGEQNTSSFKNRQVLESSDEEDDPSPITKKVKLINSDEEYSDNEENIAVIIRKNKNLLEDSNKEVVPIKKNKIVVSSDKENSDVDNEMDSIENELTIINTNNKDGIAKEMYNIGSTCSSHSEDNSDNVKVMDGDKRKQSARFEDSEEEEEKVTVSVKKTKYFINEDSD